MWQDKATLTGGKMKHAFTKELHTKGHTLKSFALFLGQPLRNIARIAANPDPIHWLAIREGLPTKPGNTRGGFTT